MPSIDFNFSGWIRGANVTEATDINSKRVDVSQMSPVELCGKLRRGELFISLGDFLYENTKADIEMTDYDPEDGLYPDER